MIKKINIYFILLILLFLLADLHSADGGKNGFALLKMDVDARAAAMGGAYTAIASDASAAFWNPAGLAGASSRSLIIMHYSWFADFAQEFASAQLMTGKHNLALSVNLLTIQDIEIRDMPSDEPYGTTEWMSFSGMISYGTNLTSDISAGVNFKYLFEKAYLEKAPGWAVDFGFKKRQIFKGLDLGLTLQNLGQMTELKQKSTPLPVIAAAGIGYVIPFQILGNNPLFATDIQYINDESFYYHFGSQLDLLTYLSIRLGWMTGNSKNQRTFGIGLNYKSFHFDYAYSSSQYKLDGNQRISLGIVF